MFIKQVSVTNLKSFKTKTDVVFQDGMNLIVGPNSGGKSNLLELIQAFFNDAFFVDANFEQANDNNQNNGSPIKPFKANQQHSDGNHLQKVFDRHINGSGASELRITLAITQDDIDNIREFEKTINELEQFELNHVDSNFIHQVKGSFDFTTNYESYIGTDLPIVFSGANDVQIDSSVRTNELNKLLHFFRWSRVLYKMAHFYKLFNPQYEVKLRPYFYYISPTRDFSLSQNEQIIDLSQVNSSSANQFSQRNINQESRLSNLGILIRILVENYYYAGKKSNSENEEFKKMLNNYLNMDFSIDQHGLQAQNKFKLVFSRMNKSSWKLSSGEREFFNLLSTVFAQNIRSGMIIIDEPEIHLHPKWQHIFLDLLKEISATRNIQIICITHSASFIRRDLLANIIRVSMISDESQVYLPNHAQTHNTSVKDQFMLVTASNNERVFFADKIILVEGYADRIIFQAILDKLYEQDKPIVEIVDVFGKGNFQRYKDFLSIWSIPTKIIADLDYLAMIDSNAKSDIFSTDEEKMLKKLSKKNTNDGKGLLKILTMICDQEAELTKQNRKLLCDLYQYLKIRHSSLVVSCNPNTVESFVKTHQKNEIFCLSKGEIEDYFTGVGKFEIDSAIVTAEKIRLGKLAIDPELQEIINDIVAN